MKEESIPVSVISEEILDQIYDFLESDQVDPEALDIIGLHGFMVALAICPDPVPTGEWLPVVFNGMPKFDDELPEEQMLDWLEAMQEATRTVLYRGQTIELPFEAELEEDEQLEDSEISAWCAGFMEAVMLREEIWFGEHEQDVAELLLPFMAISCLFPDEELDDIVSDLDITNRMVVQIPELLVDLYLLFHAPAEKPAPFKKPGGHGGKGGKSGKGGGRRGGKQRR
ncbi:YecA family protein [Oceanospirillum beijerinckii]|uniref:YecA/YgfB family protein n=1 Tax=Oceanospirillum beijerinckii TaxID=64976 RepID=UPI0006846736|nr:YecA family protein [Oceanospirillum beijerinckii]